MCGIVGFIDVNGQPAQVREEITGNMIARLHHRGPDAKGVWTDKFCGITLAHTRLAILDLSPAEHQPMKSASGRYILVFNGEIYNFKKLRTTLKNQDNAPQSLTKWRTGLVSMGLPNR